MNKQMNKKMVDSGTIRGLRRFGTRRTNDKI